MKEQRSEEVADIIERMPTAWTRRIVAVMTALVAGMILLGWLVEYPDVISGEITVTGTKPPVRMVASVSGCIHLLKADRSRVRRGDVVAHIECGASYKDMCWLDTLCRTPLSPTSQLALPPDLSLGPLSASFNAFVLAYSGYDLLRRTRVYTNLRASLDAQHAAGVQVEENLHRELVLTQAMMATLQRQYGQDSLLYRSGAISKAELEAQAQALMESRQKESGHKSSILQKRAEISTIALERAKVEVTVSEELAAAYQTLLARFNVLAGELQQWREHYVLSAQTDGMLEYLGFWRENEYVSAEQPLFAVSPVENEWVGELVVPSYGAGKIREGQAVNILLNDYPSVEFGHIRGRVAAISTVGLEMKNAERALPSYKVLVKLPQGPLSNYGKQLRLNPNTKGVGRILTARRRLIERLFDNLRTLKER